MNPTNRRQFVTSIAAVGVPSLLLIKPSEIVAQGRSSAADPVLDEITRQLYASMNDMEKGPADAARRHAAALRMLAAFGAKEGWDRQFRADLDRAIRTHGRSRLISERPDLTSAGSAYIKELTRQGIRLNKLADRFTRQVPLDTGRKSKALDDLMANGLTATLREQAETLEAVASELVQFRQASQPTKVEQKCDEINQQMYQFELLVAFACIFGTVIACGTTTASYLIWKGYVGSTYNCW
jgi:hypothetical protein